MVDYQSISGSPLNGNYRTPLGAKAIVKPAPQGAIVMVFASTTRAENEDDTYPYIGTWETQLENVEKAGAFRESNAIILIGIKRGGAYNDFSGSSYETGLDMLKPIGDEETPEYSFPSYVDTVELTIEPNIDAGPITTTITLAQLQEWYTTAYDNLTTEPKSLYLCFQNDTRSKFWFESLPVPFQRWYVDAQYPASAHAMYDDPDLTYLSLYSEPLIFGPGGTYASVLGQFINWVTPQGVTVYGQIANSHAMRVNLHASTVPGVCKSEATLISELQGQVNYTINLSYISPIELIAGNWVAGTYQFTDDVAALIYLHRYPDDSYTKAHVFTDQLQVIIDANEEGGDVPFLVSQCQDVIDNFEPNEHTVHIAYEVNGETFGIPGRKITADYAKAEEDREGYAVSYFHTLEDWGCYEVSNRYWESDYSFPTSWTGAIIEALNNHYGV